MILLDQTSCDLLRYLIQLKEPETIMTISRATNQSRRKIYYHLEKINDALAEVGEMISRPSEGRDCLNCTAKGIMPILAGRSRFL